MTYITHTVVSGDNLTKIAKKYGCTVEEIRLANLDKIKNVNLIKDGWKLKIPQRETESKNYSAVGKALEACLDDIEKLQSYKKLVNLL